MPRIVATQLLCISHVSKDMRNLLALLWSTARTSMPGTMECRLHFISPLRARCGRECPGQEQVDPVAPCVEGRTCEICSDAHRKWSERGGLERIPRDSTGLHFADLEGELEFARTLLDGGADVNARDFWGLTPLQHARRRRFHDIEYLLLARVASGE